MPVFQLNSKIAFPNPHLAEESGLLAVGGDLSFSRLKLAYSMGIFPWYSEGFPILWYAPNPRFVLYPPDLKVAKSMRPLFRKKAFNVTVNQAFEKVIAACKDVKRQGQEGTWITADIEEAYTDLYKRGIAYSVEVWEEGRLVGGLFGELWGSIFFGESMFSLVSNASKYGFIIFARNLEKIGVKLIDCQVHTHYLESLGATFMDRTVFMDFTRFGTKETLDASALLCLDEAYDFIVR